jgi:cystathionine gamma-synthase/methionine-gamma-lyase
MGHERNERWRFNTRLVHEGEYLPSEGVRPTAMPIFATSTFVHPTAEALDQAFDDNGLVYARYGNPTVGGFEQAVASIESGVGAVAFGSGMAAIYVALLAAGTPRGAMQPEPCSILAAQDLYGSTRTLLLQFFHAQGWPVTFCDMTDLDAVAAAMQSRPSIIFLEPISNPLLKIFDIARIVELARDAHARVVVDNTLASPVLLRPIELGVDLVIHSATKYLGGHGDVLGGVVTGRTNLLLDTVQRYGKLLGTTLGPQEARLLSRGLKTLSLRVRQQCTNAETVARWLQTQPQVARVYYPGLPNHPQHSLATQLFGGLYGGMVSFDLLAAERRAAFAFMDALKLVLPATTLGDVFSLVSYSAQSSHRDVPLAERQAQGIGDGLLRLSVGIEDAQDIIDDLSQSLATIG